MNGHALGSTSGIPRRSCLKRDGSRANAHGNLPDAEKPLIQKKDFASALHRPAFKHMQPTNKLRKNENTNPKIHPMKYISLTALAVIAAGAFANISLAGKKENADTPSVVAIAAGNKDFSTLVAAVTAAGLVDTLNGDGPFTIFAPTNEAFAKLPKGTVEDLLKPENKEKLVAILTYHVVAGKVMAADVKAGKVKTVQGGELEIAVKKGVTVNGAKVTKTDIVGKNGVIHVIDTVVLPK